MRNEDLYFLKPIFFPFLFSVFFLILLLPVVGVAISDYASIFLMFFVCVGFLFYPTKKYVLVAFAICVLFSLLFIVLKSKSVWYYVVVDFLTISFFYVMNDIVRKNRVRKLDVLFIKYLSLFFLIVVLLGTLNPEYYKQYQITRYMGLNLGPNLTTSILLIVFLILIEYSKIKKISRKTNLVFLILCYILIAFLTKSRGFFLGGGLVFLYYSLHFFNKRYVFLFLILLFFAFLSVFMSEIQTSLRLTIDRSFQTRLLLYETIWEEINNSWFLLPNGFEADQIVLDRTRNLEDVELHNDVLKYWFNYGVLFFFYLWYIGKELLKFFYSKWEYFVFVFVLLLNSLQNTLFSIFIMVPVFGFLAIRKYRFQVNEKTFSED